MYVRAGRALAETLWRHDSGLRPQAVSQKPDGRRRRVPGRPRHRRSLGRTVEPVEQVNRGAHRAVLPYALDQDTHDRHVFVSLVHLPHREQEARRQIDRPDARSADVDGRLGEEACLAQHAHPLGVAGVAHRLLDHVRRVDRVHEGPQAIGHEGLERPDVREVHQFEFGQRGDNLDLPAADDARRARVLLDHVDRREPGLVLVRPLPHRGKAADVDADAIRRARVSMRHARRGDCSCPGRRRSRRSP